MKFLYSCSLLKSFLYNSLSIFFTGKILLFMLVHICDYNFSHHSSSCLAHVLSKALKYLHLMYSVQVSSVTQLCPTLCNHMNQCLPVHHQIPESTQTHVHWVCDAIQPSHPLLSPFPPALNLSQHQNLFKRVNFSHEVAKVLEFQLQHQSFQWTPRTDLL